eukprot:Sdes_comp21946_c0_seq1m20489
MSFPWLSSSESVLFQAPVNWKNEPGVLFITSFKLVWCALDESIAAAAVHPRIRIPFGDIKAQKVSPAHKAKVQLQIVYCHEEKPPETFHFYSLEAMQERNSAKELLQQLLPKFRSRPETPIGVPEEIKQRARILSLDKNLQQLHKELVVQGPISEEEFWALRKELGMTNKTNPLETCTDGQTLKQQKGVSSAFLSDVRPELDGGCNGVKYTLNAAVIRSIFTTYPSVKKLFELCVPEKISESDFWTKYFQSRYFQETSLSGQKTSEDMKSGSNKNSSKEDIFANCENLEDSYKLLKDKPIVNPLIHHILDDDESENFRKDEDLHPPQRIPSKRKSKENEPDYENILERFNRHSAMVMNSLHEDVVEPCLH